MSGKKVGDLKLQRDDVIFIPQRGKTISVKGEIKRPLIFELKENETLEDLIMYAGGFIPTTYTRRAQIKRVVPFDERDVAGDRVLIDIEINKLLSNSTEIELIDADEITFFKISDALSNSVSINGAVRRPGEFGYVNKMTVKDLILKADGLTVDAYIEEGYIYRTTENGIKKQIAININEELTVKPNLRTELMPNDSIKIDFFQTCSIDQT